MLFVTLSYDHDPLYSSPERWLLRTRAYGGVLAALAKLDKVANIAQINYEGAAIDNGVQHHFANYGDKCFPRKLHRLVKSLDPDIVLVHSLNRPLQVIQLRLALPRKTRIIVQNHAEKPAVGLRKLLQQSADKFVDAYLFASKEMGLDWIAKGNLASPQKIHEVMELSSVFYPVDRTMARAKTGVDAKKAYLWVGRLDENKDPLTAVKAFLEFAETESKARLYMLYHTEELLPQIRQLLSEAPNPKAVSLVGKIPNDDMLYWFNSADFFIAASHYEGSGTALCEALSCGCVPIVSDIPSFRMITDGGTIGQLFPPGDDKKLLSALQQTQLIDITTEREKALTYFRSKLSFEAIAQQFHDIGASLQAPGQKGS